MHDKDTSNAPLTGLRIIDMTNVVMGPYATQVLADYGADVIKVEPPQGDTTRQIPPMRNPDMGCLFLHLNRNKRSIVLDLKSPDGLEALITLANQADVLVCNVRPAALARLGLSYERLAKENPRLIWISLVGFGSNGPYAGRPAYDDLIQGLTAIPSMLVQAGSETPHYVPLSFNDRAVGLHAAIALLAAVNQRHHTGMGQMIEVPMFETMVQFSLGDHIGGNSFEPPIGPPGYTRTLTKERRPYRTQDGYICAIIYTDKHWQSFFKLVNQPERFANDAQVSSLMARTKYATQLYQEVGEHMLTQTTEEWLQAFAEADIPATSLHTLDTVMQDPHLKATGFFQEVDHPSEGRIRQMSVPTSWSDWTPAPPGPAPQLGENSKEILREAGISQATIQRILEETSHGK